MNAYCGSGQRPVGTAGHALRHAFCLLVVSVFLAAAVPGGGWNTNHVHFVIGGTPSERARALALHLNAESAGLDEAPSPTPTPAAGGGGSGTVRVLSVRGDGGSGPAVFSADGNGTLLAATVQQIPVPSHTDWVHVPALLNVPRSLPSLLEPPPRRL